VRTVLLKAVHQESPLGVLTLLGGRKGLLRLNFRGSDHEMLEWSKRWVAESAVIEWDSEAHKTWRQRLSRYFAGRFETFGDGGLDPRGTEFQKRVWREILRIPYGQTRTYGELATKLGNPDGARAVGLAAGQNPLAIVVPCHRVVGGRGHLRGYGGGIESKRYLLNLEHALPQPDLFGPPLPG
jgi:methylated-DNA-[protein]-cysteine S-methyltransferase